jgi:hypothetical protein
VNTLQRQCYTLDIIRNKFALRSQPALAHIDAQVV